MVQSLRSQIEDFYLPRQLVEAILEVGGIPVDSEEVEIGVGFIDIANYTFLSKFLTPKENQEVLNGLYTAFNSVLRRRGGYLNKIEGDSLMFHYGGVIDSRARKLPDVTMLRRYIARELFFTCVEMQRVALLFNDADTRFLDDEAGEEDRASLERAFAIIKRLRSDSAISNPMTALFQIRIRVGANLGEVTIGNFGPDGARQWDVIGMPVIDAKRMETTAPVGGLRISRGYFRILEESGIVDEYYERFRREARALGSSYANITRDELFLVRRVVIREKNNAFFETCSVQVNPRLPEQTADQVEALLQHNRYGADQIVSLIKYYRGNRYVITAIEERLTARGVTLRFCDSYRLLYPKRYGRMLAEHGSRENVERALQAELDLHGLLAKLGHYQDIINRSTVDPVDQTPFATYESHVAAAIEEHQRFFEALKAEMAQRAYFHNVVFPMVFSVLLAAILEHQTSDELLEEMEEVDESVSVDEISELEEPGELEELSNLDELEELEEL